MSLRQARRPCLWEEPSPDDFERHLDAQLAPQQRQQNMLRVPNWRRHGRVSAAAQAQERLYLRSLSQHVSAVSPAALAGKKQTWQRCLPMKTAGTRALSRSRCRALRAANTYRNTQQQQQQHPKHANRENFTMHRGSYGTRCTVSSAVSCGGLIAGSARAWASSMQEPAVRVSDVRQPPVRAPGARLTSVDPTAPPCSSPPHSPAT